MKKDMKLVKAPLHDGFYKIERLILVFNKQFQDVVEEGCVAIDEQMTLYNGTKCPTGLKQDLLSKPIAHGFKNWARWGTCGYIYEMTFYTGKRTPVTLERRSSNRRNWASASEPEPKTAQVVLKLTETKPPGSYIYVDNLFGSTELLYRLFVGRGLHLSAPSEVPNWRAVRCCPMKSLKRRNEEHTKCSITKWTSLRWVHGTTRNFPMDVAMPHIRPMAELTGIVCF